MLEILPKGVMHLPGTGIHDNLADKAKKLGIPVWKFGGVCAPPTTAPAKTGWETDWRDSVNRPIKMTPPIKMLTLDAD